MKNSFFRGLISGFIFTLLISSICSVTFYGLEHGIASSIDVFIINLLFMMISIFVAFVLKKMRILNKMKLISNILIGLFGALVFSGIFYENIRGFLTIDYVIPGPIVQIPSVFWLIVVLGATIADTGIDENQKCGLLKFMIGEIISVVILWVIDFVLTFSIGTIHNAWEVNNIINSIIQGICSVGIIGYSTYRIKKYLDSYKV